ncbi:hypothetical protein ETAA8_10100 [Anatilimnocola aggregata]|uniref:Uncharacterized protein n=1 Tax=Anatilimnocola aggregata TaxID=2528021 RepID=A0A517Y6S2_9BACT|nr:hypothetical protein [Anatilimnocola aggregata]QDU25938.1 hypothetical protein ETAA8_10100 [Anatilimnocola aggregata]
MTKTRAGKTKDAATTASETLSSRDQSVSPHRIDAAHEGTGSAATTTPEMMAALADSALTAAAENDEIFHATAVPRDPLQDLALREEQLQLQAAQLAGHLKARLTEVDRRESQLNARIAQLEADLRSARLWQREREYEFQQREGELCRQVEDLQQRSSEVAIGEQQVQTLDERAEQIITREQELKALDLQLRQRRQELDRQAAAFSHAQSLWQLQQKHEEAAARQQRERAEEVWTRAVAEERQELDFEIAGRRRKLETGEQVLREQQQRLDQERVDFERMRVQGTNQLQRERAAWDERLQAIDLEFVSRKRELESREAIVERQRVAMEQMRTEIGLVHRQSLEMRLIAEQLWAQITGRLSSAEITRSIASLRLQLSQQYEQEQKALTKQKDELVQLAERLQGQHQLLTAERQEVRNWGSARQAGIEQQARQLVEREQQLESEQQELRASRQNLHDERRRYEQEIRDLATQLREATTSPAAA